MMMIHVTILNMADVLIQVGGINNFTCSCVPGYEGKTCEVIKTIIWHDVKMENLGITQFFLSLDF